MHAPPSRRPPNAGRRRLVRLGAVVLAAGAALLALPSPAQAETRLNVEAGWDGRYRPGRPMPVKVEIRADRLVQGTLTVTSGDGTDVSLRVEVPGGSVKEFLLIVPTSLFDDQAEVRASLRTGDEQTRGEDEVEFDPTEELVGLLPAVTPADLPSALPFAGESGTARFVEIGEDELAAAPGSLAGLSTLVTGADELGQLAGATRQAVLGWVSAGGHLLVDAPPGVEITGVPDAWQPGDAGRVTAGMGEIRLTGGAAIAGRWADIVEPTPNIAGQDLLRILENSPFGFVSIGDGIARDAGLRVATPGWLLGFLIAYVVLAGPVTWLVLRTLKRPGLAWVAVPVVAVVFAGASFVVGRDLRSGTQAAHGTVVATSPAGATGTTFVGSVSKNGGDARVAYPPGWTLGTVDQSNRGIGSNTVSVALSGDHVSGLIPLDAGDFGLVRGDGAMSFEGGLEIEATAVDNDTVSGTVRNTTEHTLEEVGLFVGRRGDNVGTLAPGEAAEFDIDAGRGVDAWEPIENRVWGGIIGWDGPPDPDNVVNISLWADASMSGGPNFLAPGSVVAAGWTRSLDVPARGGRQLAGRAVIIGRGRVDSAPGTLNPLAVDYQVLRTGDGAEAVVDAFDAGGEFSGHLLRVTPPSDAPTTGLALAVGPDVSALQVWRDGQWETIENQVDELDPNVGFVGDPGQRRDIDLPDGSIEDGGLLIRALTNFFVGTQGPPQLELRVQGADA